MQVVLLYRPQNGKHRLLCFSRFLGETRGFVFEYIVIVPISWILEFWSCLCSVLLSRFVCPRLFSFFADFRWSFHHFLQEGHVDEREDKGWGYTNSTSFNSKHVWIYTKNFKIPRKMSCAKFQHSSLESPPACKCNDFDFLSSKVFSLERTPPDAAVLS